MIWLALLLFCIFVIIMLTYMVFLLRKKYFKEMRQSKEINDHLKNKNYKYTPKD